MADKNLKGKTLKLNIQKTTISQSTINMVYLHPSVLSSNKELVSDRDRNSKDYDRRDSDRKDLDRKESLLNQSSNQMALIDSKYLYMPGIDSTINPKNIAISKIQREFLNKTLNNDTINVNFINDQDIKKIDVIKFEIEKLGSGEEELSGEEIKKTIKGTYNGFPFNLGQKLYLEISPEYERSNILILTVADIEVTGGEMSEREYDRGDGSMSGKMMGSMQESMMRDTMESVSHSTHSPSSNTLSYSTHSKHSNQQTEYALLAHSSNIVLTSNKHRLFNNKGIMKTGFSFEEIGIGGLKKEFEQMFRRAFVQRLFEPDLIKGFGISHVKGIMLHGPPGTGKTLIARKLGSLLDAKPPKIVNGPEILNKYVGQSEENIRNLFKEAEEDYRRYMENSPLHIIIFDEIDAICKRRGSSGSAGVGDQVVNQLLSKIDGVEALNNILIIGMTNRLDLIDEALLRPGRFEIHLEIGLPDEEARREIFQIHTKEMGGNNHLESDVNLETLGKMSKNYTGAEIAAVVRGAVSYSLERKAHELELLNKEKKEISETEKMNVKVTMRDMLNALEETRPAFGMDEEEFDVYNKVFYEIEMTKKVMTRGEEMLRSLRRTNLYKTSGLLLYGATGTGKTTLAVKMALKSQFPYLKIVSPKDLVGLSENEKVNFIKTKFMDAYKSEEACIILDDIEGLIEYVGIGPRFNNAILQAIKIYIKAESKNKLFVFGTTTLPGLMEDSGLFESFADCEEVLNCGREDYESLCEQNEEFRNIEFEGPVPIKKLLVMLPEADMKMA